MLKWLLSGCSCTANKCIATEMGFSFSPFSLMSITVSNIGLHNVVLSLQYTLALFFCLCTSQQLTSWVMTIICCCYMAGWWPRVTCDHKCYRFDDRINNCIFGYVVNFELERVMLTVIKRSDVLWHTRLLFQVSCIYIAWGEKSHQQPVLGVRGESKSK